MNRDKSGKPDKDLQSVNEPAPAWLKHFSLTPEEIESLREETLRSLEQLRNMRTSKSKLSK